MPTVLDFNRLRETLLPEWTKPENASVFDPAYRAPVRTLIKWLGLDDPQQVMAFGTPLEAGPMAGGAIEAIGKRFPRFAEALKSYTHPGQQPFYSRLEEAVQGLPKQVPAPKLLGVVQKGQASAEELAARGVPEFAAQYGTKAIPKEAIAAHLEANPVQLQVKTAGGPRQRVVTDARYTIEPAPGGMGGVFRDSSGRAVGASNTMEQLQRNAEEWAGAVRAGRYIEDVPGFREPKFAQYQLPGGTNYRETLITLPEQPHNEYEALVKRFDAKYGEGFSTERLNPAERQAFNRAWNSAVASPGGMTAQTFKSSHFDEPNILVHTRSNERDLPGLGRGTFLEEVQSDWHQQGKAKGYAGSSEINVRELNGNWQVNVNGEPVSIYQNRGDAESLANDYRAGRRIVPGQVPNAPFKETWPDLALKHHLVEAAQNPETNWLGFTSGETQAARYDLSKHIDELHYQPDRQRLLAFDKNGDKVIDENVAKDKIADYVGKEAAQKLLETKPGATQYAGSHVLSGVDLKVGGEGMKYFYDTLLPKRLEKIVKPFGGAVERVPMRASDFPEPVTPGDLAAARARARNKVEEAGGQVQSWIVRLTPEMKRRILTEGVPLMTGVAAVGSAQREK